MSDLCGKGLHDLSLPENVDRTSGYRRCRPCMNASGRAWKERNRDRALSANRAWRKAHPERQAAASRAWYQQNRERKAATDRAFYERNRERRNAQSSEWKERNPDKRRQMRARYRAALKGAETEGRTYAGLLERDGLTCYLCGEDNRPDLLHIQSTDELWIQRPSFDHLVPLSRGGSDLLDNIRVVHLICNVVKGDSLLVPSDGVA